MTSAKPSSQQTPNVSNLNNEHQLELGYGQKLSCVTLRETRLEGEITAFDKQLNIAAIKTGDITSGGLAIVNLSNIPVSNLKTNPTPSSVTSQSFIPDISVDKVKQRYAKSVAEEQRKSVLINSSVTSDAQELMFALNKVLPQMEWSDKNIMVQKLVLIKPPYTEKSCVPVGDKSNYVYKDCLDRVKKLVQKHRTANASGFPNSAAASSSAVMQTSITETSAAATAENTSSSPLPRSTAGQDT